MDAGDCGCNKSSFHSLFQKDVDALYRAKRIVLLNIGAAVASLVQQQLPRAMK